MTPPRLSITDRFVLFGIIGQGFGLIGTVWAVEVAPSEDEREAARRTDYAALAGTVLGSSIIGAIAMALEPPEERR